MLESLHDVIMATALLHWRRKLRAKVPSGEAMRNNGKMEDVVTWRLKIDDYNVV